MIFSKIGFGQAKNMYNSPSHIDTKVKSIDSTNRKTIEAEYGDYITTFEISKMKKLKIGKINTDDSGLVIITDSSNKEIVLFDNSKHGYNGLYGLTNVSEVDTFDIKELKNKQLIVAFQYGGDEVANADENQGNPQDYFDWIVIYIINDNQLVKVFEYECV